MAAGQGFKTFVTGEVLTAGDVNGYLMQGINVFTNATARDAAITAPAEGQFAFTKDNNSLWYYDGAAWVASGATGDIEGVTAGVGISGGGTSGTVTVTNSMATAIDAKGDLVPGTGADTFARLAVGANDTVLTADSTTATGLKWATVSAGGMTLISTTSMSGSSVSLTSIPSTYVNLVLLIQGWSNISSLYLRSNNTTGSNYVNDGSTTTEFFSTNNLNYPTTGEGQRNSLACTIFNYATTATTKTCHTVGTALLAGTTTYYVYNKVGQNFGTGNTAISSIQIVAANGTFSSGTAYLYGAK